MLRTLPLTTLSHSLRTRYALATHSLRTRYARMDQTIWGPKMWHILHTVSFTYPKSPTCEQKNQFKTFYMSLQHILPCSVCRSHYKENLKINPIDNALDSRVDLVKWVIDFHNLVNYQLGKRQYSYDEVVKMYHKIYRSPYRRIKPFWIWLLVILVIIFIAVLFYRKGFKK